MFDESGLCTWSSRRGEFTIQQVDCRLRPVVLAVRAATRGAQRSPPMQAALRALGQQAIGRNRLAHLMREGGVQGRRRRRFRLTTKSDHQHPGVPKMLKRRF
jgi:transposase InsO family protein